MADSGGCKRESVGRSRGADASTAINGALKKGKAESSFCPGDFDITSVLSNNSAAESMVVLAKEKTSGARGILKMSLPSLSGEDAKTIVAEPESASREIFRNERFSKHRMRRANEVIIEVICPALEKDVLKYTPESRTVLRETPSVYREVTLPAVEAIPASDIQWVYNILDGKKEEILVREQGFVLLRDYKWTNTKKLVDMHMLAISTERKAPLRSIRDLRAAHLPMLKSLREAALQFIEAQYGIPPYCVMTYLHYMPTFWHLHVHFTHVGASITATNASGFVFLPIFYYLFIFTLSQADARAPL